MTEPKPLFDFPALKDTFEREDTRAWTQFYTEEAQWIEYKPPTPPSDSVCMVARERTAQFASSLEGSDVEISLSDESLVTYLAV